MMIRQRRVANNSPTSTICYDDVETCYSPPQEVLPSKSRRASGGKPCCSKLGRRLCALVLFVTVILYGWSHCRRAYELYNLPGVQELLKESSPVLEGEYVVFLTASTGEPGETYIKMGKSSRSATYALMQAQAKVAKLPKKFPWIKIDVVDTIERIEDFDYFNSIDAPGDWFGIALDWHSGWAFLPEEVQSRALMDKENVMRWERIMSYAKTKKLKGMPIPDLSDDASHLEFIDVFQTASVFYDLNANSITPVPVYHGHRMYDEITPDVLSSAMIDAGKYMASSVDDNNTFVYNYLPRSDYEPSGYNLTRHAAAVFTLSWLYSKWEDAELLEAIKKAMKHLQRHVQSCSIPHAPAGHTARCVVEQDDHVQLSKLGINAMTVLAIAEYTRATKDKNYLNTAKAIAKWIEGTKREDGSFVHRVDLPNFDLNENHHLREYHGQVGFALSRLYSVVKSFGMSVDESWLDVAAAAIQYQVSEDKDGDEEEEFVIDHWLLYAIGELPDSRMTPDFVEHAMSSIRIASDHQNDEMEDEEELDELGIFFHDLSTTVTAATTEGLCAVHRLAVEKGHSQEAETIVESVIMGLRYQLQSQYQPEHAMYMRDPKRIIGGFSESIVDTEMRLDNTYHSLGSMVCAADMIANSATEQASEQE